MTRLGRSVSLAVVAVAVTAVALCSAEEAEEAANEIPDSPYGKVAFNDQGYTFVAEQPGADLNAKTGVGAIYDPSGRLVYRGSVKAGEADGSGTLHLPNGEKIRGKFEKNQPVEGDVFGANGALEFSGSFKNGAPEYNKGKQIEDADKSKEEEAKNEAGNPM